MLDRCGLTISEMSYILQWVQLDAEVTMPTPLKQRKAKPTSKAEQRGVWNSGSKWSEHWPGENKPWPPFKSSQVTEASPTFGRWDGCVITRQILKILKTQCPSFARLNSLPSDTLWYLLIQAAINMFLCLSASGSQHIHLLDSSHLPICKHQELLLKSLPRSSKWAGCTNIWLSLSHQQL